MNPTQELKAHRNNLKAHLAQNKICCDQAKRRIQTIFRDLCKVTAAVEKTNSEEYHREFDLSLDARIAQVELAAVEAFKEQLRQAAQAGENIQAMFAPPKPEPKAEPEPEPEPVDEELLAFIASITNAPDWAKKLEAASWDFKNWDEYTEEERQAIAEIVDPSAPGEPEPAPEEPAEAEAEPEVKDDRSVLIAAIQGVENFSEQLRNAGWTFKAWEDYTDEQLNQAAVIVGLQEQLSPPAVPDEQPEPEESPEPEAEPETTPEPEEAPEEPAPVEEPESPEAEPEEQPEA